MVTVSTLTHQSCLLSVNVGGQCGLWSVLVNVGGQCGLGSVLVNVGGQCGLWSVLVSLHTKDDQMRRLIGGWTDTPSPAHWFISPQVLMIPACERRRI